MKDDFLILVSFHRTVSTMGNGKRKVDESDLSSQESLSSLSESPAPSPAGPIAPAPNKSNYEFVRPNLLTSPSSDCSQEY